MTVLLDRSTEVVAGLVGVTVRRGGASLLHQLDWCIRRGERWVVLGANGAGKSTLLSVLSGGLRPSYGRVELLGEPLDDADLDELLPRIGWCSATLAEQLPADLPVLDVVLGAIEGTVALAGPVEPADLDRADRLLAQLGCARLTYRGFGSLSEGERKRVQLARALMTDPELLLLDEPAAGLDLGGREALLRMLTRLGSDPDAPVQVLVSHHVEEIPAGTTHALLLRDGAVVSAGPVRDALTAATLTRAFGFPLRLDSSDGRWVATAAL